MLSRTHKSLYTVSTFHLSKACTRKEMFTLYIIVSGWAIFVYDIFHTTFILSKLLSAYKMWVRGFATKSFFYTKMLSFTFQEILWNKKNSKGILSFDEKKNYSKHFLQIILVNIKFLAFLKKFLLHYEQPKSLPFDLIL